jgi:hypothetical protein
MTGAHKVHSDRRCPDCTGRLLVESYHDESCPLFMAIKAEFNRDREWFEAHPAAHEYYRPVSPTESIHLLALDFDLNAMPPGWHWGGQVLVGWVSSGARMRDFSGVDLCVYTGGAA